MTFIHLFGLGGVVALFDGYASHSDVLKCLARRCMWPPAQFTLKWRTSASTSVYVGNLSSICNGVTCVGTGLPGGGESFR